MSIFTENLRLRELVAIVRENRLFYEDFVAFLQESGYPSAYRFVQEGSDEKALAVIKNYLRHQSDATLYDGLLRPYPNPRARWYFLAWMMRDAPVQRLQPFLAGVPGDSLDERKAFLLNEIRKFVEPLFPDPESWEWPAVSEVMLARLEGSRRAIKGTLFEEIIRRNLRGLFDARGLPLAVSDGEIRLHDETYDIQVTGSRGAILLPVKTRETMGGGHAGLFTRDIFKAISVAEENGYRCIPVIIAESWAANLDALRSESYIYIRANPNQVAQIEPQLTDKLAKLVPAFRNIA